jgi:nitroreductase
MNRYDFAVNPWQVLDQNFPENREDAEKLKFLLRYAILAPSSHNTQPWKFTVSPDEIRVRLNLDRWLRSADPDRRDLYISIGCTIENLLVAAEHFGYSHEVDYLPELTDPRLVAAIKLRQDGGMESPRRHLFRSIAERHTNHGAYQTRPISDADLEQIQACALEEGVSLYLTSEPSLKLRVDELANRADAMWLADPASREELEYLLEEGAFGATWMVSKLSQLAVAYLEQGEWVEKRECDILLGASCFGLLCSTDDLHESQVKVGQALESIYLTATSLGLQLQPMSQVVHIPATRRELAGLLDLGDSIPQQAFRLGYARREPAHAPRRPLEEAMA